MRINSAYSIRHSHDVPEGLRSEANRQNVKKNIKKTKHTFYLLYLLNLLLYLKPFNFHYNIHDKRYIMPDGVHKLPYGHYKISLLQIL